MTTKGPPKGFELTENWWLSGSAWEEKTLSHVLSALNAAQLNKDKQALAILNFYASHPTLARYITPAVRKEMKEKLGVTL